MTDVSRWFDKLGKLTLARYGLGIHSLPPFGWSTRFQADDTPQQAIIAFDQAYPTYSRMYARRVG